MHEEINTKNSTDAHERINGASTSKKSHKQHSQSPLRHQFTNSSNLVTVMMDEKAQEAEDHSFYIPLRRDENGHHSAEYDEGMKFKMKAQKVFEKRKNL
jgi:hypothetical protein